MALKKNGTILTSLELWRTLAAPKADYHWVEGRSAMEAAKTWLRGGGLEMPPEVAQVLERHERFGPVISWEGEPEAKLAFDGLAGEPRNSDLAISAIDRSGPYFLAIEAKADEPFGDTLAQTLASAVKRRAANPRSKGQLRLEQLVKALLGLDTVDAETGALRYQLLTACAGALCEAQRRGCDRAVMLVEEFVTDRTADPLHARNATDLQRFLEAVERASIGRSAPVRGGTLSGPYVVPGLPLLTARVELLVGKITHDLRTA